MRLSPLLPLFVLASAASAAPVVNGGFETSNVASSFLYSHQGLQASPWTFSFYAGVTASNTAWGGAAQEGGHFAFLQTTSQDGTTVGALTTVTQTLTGLTPGTPYAVSFYARQRPGYAANRLNVVGTTAVNLAPAADWTLYSGTFVPALATFDLQFAAVGLSNADAGSFVDNVSVQAVPEPSAVAALGLGALGLLRRRRR